MTGKEWYSERELFEMIQGLKQDLNETRVIIKRYNGLWEKLDDLDTRSDDLDTRIVTIEQQDVGRRKASRNIVQLSGWIVAIVGFLLTWGFRLIGGE